MSETTTICEFCEKECEVIEIEQDYNVFDPSAFDGVGCRYERIEVSACCEDEFKEVLQHDVHNSTLSDRPLTPLSNTSVSKETGVNDNHLSVPDPFSPARFAPLE